ncbi:OmpA family protein [Flavobacterium laiguense]|uniref:Cell envelope biogenesis protein OmpA n=1 Tax=Flavobacterium laiguense TaxID=2169409 RepID=A0A2U1JPL8_9FLAO|nr:OmpA family protein [Flavobacterium laiguense]PWA07082.1 cell envelope biogenesis protein OmpA [Flavobacterium laiguense]
MKFLAALLFCFTVSSVFSQEQVSFYFDSNTFSLKKEELLKLNQWLVKHKEDKILGVYGFCDEEGSVGYNDTLARKRIDYVFNAIKGKVKIREDFKTRSFGELHALSKIKAENRKVTLYYIQPKDFGHETEIIKEKKEIEVVKKREIVKFPDKLAFENPDGSITEFKMDTIFMRKVSLANVGEKIKLENMNFYINTFAIMPQSRAKMYELLTVLKSCPDMKIQIQGHICCVTKDIRDLATQRAKAIYKFLEYNEIDKSRMTFVGYGSDRPLYPIPEKSEAEREANRRVEIEIISN